MKIVITDLSEEISDNVYSLRLEGKEEVKHVKIWGRVGRIPGLVNGMCKGPKAGLILANIKIWNAGDQGGKRDETNIRLAKPGVNLKCVSKT